MVKTYNHILVSPLTPTIGAEIGGFDLRKPMSTEVLDEVRRALLDYLVIFFRPGELSPVQLRNFGAQFGRLEPHDILKGLDECPDILEIFTEPEDEHVYAEGWHADSTYQEVPTAGSILYAVELPSLGGDTLFANQYLAYESLSCGLRGELDELRAVHSSELVYGVRQHEQDIRDEQLALDKTSARSQRAVHPVVRTHPETGRSALFVNDQYTIHFEGMTREESAPLLEYLFKHAVRPEFTCRFEWQPHSIAFWDNRCLLHSPIGDYHGQRRYMHRLSLSGCRPR